MSQPKKSVPTTTPTIPAHELAQKAELIAKEAAGVLTGAEHHLLAKIRGHETDQHPVETVAAVESAENGD